MIAPAKAGKFTLYGAERQGFAAERAILVPPTLHGDRSHAPRGNASRDAPCSSHTAGVESGTDATQSVTGCIPTQERGNDHSAALLRRPGPKPPPNHIQHITPIAQWNGTEQGEVAENEGLTLNRTAHRHVLQHLRDGANSIVGSVGQDIQRRVGIDEQGGHVGAVAG